MKIIKIYVYERILDDEKFISNYSVENHDVKTTISLKPWEAIMYKL